MSAHPPPVPPDQRPPQGSSKAGPASDAAGKVAPATDPNVGEQGAAGNIKQNTTNKGHQQDR